MPEIPLRDKLAQEITDNIGKRYRDKRRKAVKQAEMIHTYASYALSSKNSF
jgi:hypothetical protein